MDELSQLLQAADLEFGSVPTVAAEPELTGGEVATGFARSAAAGPTFGLSQQLEAAARAPFTEQTYGEELANIRQQQRAFESEYPLSALGTELTTGLLLNPLGALSAVGKGAQVASKSASIAKPIQAALRAERIAKPLAKVGQFIESVPGGITTARIAGYPATQAALESAIRTEGDITEKAKQAGIGAGAGTVLSFLGGTVGRKLSKLDQEADRLLLSSYDITGADVKKLIKKQMAAGRVPTSIDEIPIPQTLRAFEKAEIIKPDADKAQNLIGLLKHQNTVGSDVSNLLKDANKAIQPFADFQEDATKRYLSTLSGKAKESAADLAAAERQAIRSQFENGGDLLDLQRAKTGLNYTWDNNPLTRTVQKAVRQDLRKEIESRVAAAAAKDTISSDAALELKRLNQEYGKAEELKDIFAARLGSEMGGDAVEDIFMSMRTTGGAGTALQMATQSGNILPAVAGAVLTAARVPEAKRELADILTDPIFRQYAPMAGRALEQAPLVRGGARAEQQFVEEIPQAREERQRGERIAEQLIAQRAAQQPLIDQLQQLNEALKGIERQPAAEGEAKPLPVDQEPRARRREISLTPDAPVEDRIARFTREDPIIQAIIWQESRGNPKAKSRAGAAGLMQIMPGTAKDLGVDDRLDPEQSITGGTKYYQQQLETFDDPELALAAYNWGPGNVKRALAKLRAKGREETWDNVVRFTSVPTETRNYVDPVIRRSREIAKNPQKWWESKLRA
jgi:hypothetical protein